MTEWKKELLSTLSTEQLVYLIDQMDKSLCLISEVCVDESKRHIESEYAVRKIREYIYDMPSAYNEVDLKAIIDMKMGKITPKECRKIMGFE